MSKCQKTSKVAYRFAIAILLAASASVAVSVPVAFAQGGGCIAGQVISPPTPLGLGQPAPGAIVRVCPSSATGTPCSPLASAGLFSDPALTNPISNPFTADQNGIYSFCTSQGNYLVQTTPMPGTVYSSLASVATAPTPSCTVTFSATPTFTAATCSAFAMTLTSNVTSSTVTGGINGQTITFSLCQDGVGARTFAWPTNFTNPPVLTGSISACQQDSFILLSDNKWHWTAQGESNTVVNNPPGGGLQTIFGPMSIVGNLNLNGFNILNSNAIVSNPSGAQTINGTLGINGPLTTNSTLTTLGNDTLSGQNVVLVYSYNGMPAIDNNKYACSGAGLASAETALVALGGGYIDARGCTGNIIAGSTLTFSVPTRLMLDTVTLTLNGNPGFSCVAGGVGSSIVGAGMFKTVLLSTAPTAHMLAIACQLFQIEDMDINMLNTVDRPTTPGAACVMNWTNQQGTVQRIRVNGPAAGGGTVNGGTIFCHGNYTASATTYRDISLVGGVTWSDGWFLQSAGPFTISQVTVDTMFSYNNTFTGELYNLDSYVDTFSCYNCQVGSSGNIVHTQNTLGLQQPRWVHFVGSHLECGSTTAANAILLLDSVNDFEYGANGYMATCKNAVVVGALANKVNISHNIIVNTGQEAVVIKANSTNVLIDDNFIMDSAQTAMGGPYDAILVKANASNFDISGNTFVWTTGPKPNHGINIESGTSGFFSVSRNNGTTVAFVSGFACINGATGGDQNVWGNPGGCQDKHIDSSNQPAIYGSGIVINENNPLGAASGAAPFWDDNGDHMLTFNPNNTVKQHVPITIVLTSQYTNSTGSFTSIAGGNTLQWPVNASENYTAICHLYYQAAASGGLNIEFTGPSIGAGSLAYGLSMPVSATTVAGNGVATAYTTPLGAAVTTANVNFDATVSFSLINGANAGTVTMLAASSAAVQLQIQANSFCWVK